ncbi:MAG TPA: DUF4012 domain-containing protein [Candidatus Paceibacterota bacterium]|nr:DUF4012 domain-containing protein [Candidatus Paceibacterota bacterium]
MNKVSDKKPNILKALFDIKPVDKTGRVDVRKIAKVVPVVNLAPVKTKPPELSSRADEKFFFGVWDDEGVKDLGVVDYKVAKEKVKPKPKIAIASPQISPQEEFEAILSRTFDVRKEIKSIGGKTVAKRKAGKPRLRPILPKTKSASHADNYQTILSQINQRTLPEIEELFLSEPREIYPLELTTSDVKASPEIESWVRYAKTQNVKLKAQKILKLAASLFGRKVLTAIAIVSFSALTFSSFGQYGISVKNEVMKESNLAVANLEQANENLRVLDFEAASNNFAEAYEEFSRAGESLNFMGASITSLFAELPGFDKLTAGGAGKLKSAKNLVEAGKLLAEAGKSMSDVPLPNLLSVETQGLGPFKNALISAGKNLSKASALLAKVSADDLPKDKREAFLEFQSKLPELEGIVSDAVEYTSFLERFLGAGLATSDVRGTSDVKYLILFQNDSELRPTGGFPGTYAVVTFKDGRLDGFLVDDVYNLDGQLKENIIPPKPLQHITPNWGMRDANWFVDFSASAQKTMEFFKKEAGYEIDGVITMSPRMISDILKVVGPIEMPEYGFAVSDENFLSTIQAEVEYGDNREQPKKVVVDMAPKLLERINSSDPGKWLDIFNVFVSGLDKKDILMYFKDLSLEQFVANKEFGGLIKNTDEDYLMVTLTNVKGSKTDRVTDNSIKVSVRFEEGRMIHKLELTRQHNGGSTRYGFYNKQNPAYVRVLVPEGSELLSISGNSDPGYKPLINYSNSNFEQDDNLFKLESGFNFESENGVSIYNESSKTGFAFWLITDPGKQKTVELEYIVPVPSHNIYIQKQPGLEVDNFEFQVGDVLLYNGDFDKDLELRFKAE